MGFFSHSLLGKALKSHARNREKFGLPSPPGIPTGDDRRPYQTPGIGMARPMSAGDEDMPMRRFGPMPGGGALGGPMPMVPPETDQAPPMPDMPPMPIGRPGQFNETQTNWLRSLSPEDRMKEMLAATAAHPRAGMSRRPMQSMSSPSVVDAAIAGMRAAVPDRGMQMMPPDRRRSDIDGRMRNLVAAKKGKPRFNK